MALYKKGAPLYRVTIQPQGSMKVVVFLDDTESVHCVIDDYDGSDIYTQKYIRNSHGSVTQTFQSQSIISMM